MWASSPTLSKPSPCVPQTIIAASRTTKPAERCSTSAVSNKFQRRPPPHNDGGDHHHNNNKNSTQDIIGDLGLSVLTALKSNPQSKPIINPITASSIKTPNSNQKQRQQKSIEEQDERELSGSDVLLALQRAAAQKIKTKKKKKMKMKMKMKRRDYPNKNRGGSDTEREEDDDEEDEAWKFGEVRPICVKSEWNTRLDELEKRLQELIHNTTTTTTTTQ